MAPKISKRAKRWSMYPDLDADVSRLLADSGLSLHFHNVGNDENSTEAYDTAIMGRFHCRNSSCPSAGWSSKQIAITIRLYEYNSGTKYNACVYHQRCKSCSLSRPVLDNSYAERVAYRLKKWHGIETEISVYFGGSKGPHNSRLCEGCNDGHCSQIERDGFVKAMRGLSIH
ncbi:hypothetical protein ACJ73_02098 [Blastomyces percursus]|uniref:3CxxC-type domain-containing protein n=1 Tax=Blastomyces percursus TaxID=1658174 RepID=A0A1J9RFU6_9EURO|nr:hypothetical protein ACJ73_02098 [Blastomyces percursus]